MINSKLSKKQIAAIAILSIFLFSSLIANLKGISNNCFHGNDFGIYQQGIYEVAEGNSLNPYLTVRGVKLFNDHFELILFLPIVLTKIFGYHPEILIVYEWLWFACLIPLLFFLNRRKYSTNALIIAATMIIFSRGVITGIQYPIHPTTWSIPAWVMLGYFLYQKQFRGVLLTSIALCIFRESFAFCVTTLSFFYLLNREWKKFLPIFILGGSFTIFAFVIRPMLFGDLFGHGNSLVQGLLHHPIDTIVFAVGRFDCKNFIKLFIPGILSLALIIKYEKLTITKFRSHPAFAMILTMAPLFILHALANMLNIHYGVPFASAILGVILFSSLPNIIAEKPLLKWILIASFIYGSSGNYTKLIKLAYANRSYNCKFSSENLKNIEKMKKIIWKLPNHTPIFVSGGLVPSILRPNMTITFPAAFGGYLKKYDYLILQMNGYSNIKPYRLPQLVALKERCRPFAKQIIIDNQYLFFIKGEITEECLRQL